MTLIKLDDAIAAVENTLSFSMKQHMLDAIAALPTVSVSEEMVNAAYARGWNDAFQAKAELATVSDGWDDIAEAARYYMSQIGQGYEAHKLPMGPTQIEADRRLRAALAALGPLPAPPSE
jgi:hypothetical protein